jgi:hypothetical protein
MSSLPLHILLEIMGEDLKVGWTCIRAFPKLGRFSLNHQVEVLDIILTRKSDGEFYLVNGKIYRYKSLVLNLDQSMRKWIRDYKF